MTERKIVVVPTEADLAPIKAMLGTRAQYVTVSTCHHCKAEGCPKDTATNTIYLTAEQAARLVACELNKS